MKIFKCYCRNSCREFINSLLSETLAIQCWNKIESQIWNQTFVQIQNHIESHLWEMREDEVNERNC